MTKSPLALASLHVSDAPAMTAGGQPPKITSILDASAMNGNHISVDTGQRKMGSPLGPLNESFEAHVGTVFLRPADRIGPCHWQRFRRRHGRRSLGTQQPGAVSTFTLPAKRL